jgi:hypothetical protein
MQTSQIVDAAAHGAGPLGPTGLIVANDVSSKRCDMLTHNLQRMAAPSVVVTCQDARFISPLADGQLFDRVLADVPCSCDGTLRKSASNWASWTSHGGLSLHSLQLAIARRGAALLAPGGRLVYSTCSLNPAENEAVVAALLQSPEGRALALVDASGEVPGLRRAPGLDDWTLYDSAAGAAFATRAAAEAAGAQKLVSAPRTTWSAGAAANAGLHLGRCMRFWPHEHDTGGFFVAVLEREAVLPAKEAPAVDAGAAALAVDAGAAAPAVDAGAAAPAVDAGAAAPAKPRDNPPKSLHHIPMLWKPGSIRVKGSRIRLLNVPMIPAGAALCATVRAFWGCGDDFPFDRLFVRAAALLDIPLRSDGAPVSLAELCDSIRAAARRIYLLSAPAAALVTADSFEVTSLSRSTRRGPGGEVLTARARLLRTSLRRVQTAGVVAFERKGGRTPHWRLTSTAAPVLAGSLAGRSVALGRADMRTALGAERVAFTDFSEPVRKKLEKLGAGCAVKCCCCLYALYHAVPRRSSLGCCRS